VKENTLWGWMSQGSSDQENNKHREENSQAVPSARRGGETQYSWVEPNAWTKSMLKALSNGVKGGKVGLDG